MKIPWIKNNLYGAHAIVGNYVFKRYGKKGSYSYRIYEGDRLLDVTGRYAIVKGYYSDALCKEAA